MHQTHHSQRYRYRDAGGHQGTFTRAEFDIDRTVEVDTGVTGMSAARERQIGIQANNRQTLRHEAQDYP